MKTTIKTGVTVLLVLSVASCKKEDNAIQFFSTSDKNSTEELISGTNNSAKYTSVKIGTQKWMIKNLDVTRYKNGDKIPQVKDSAKWANLTTGAWCYYNNDTANGNKYGKLYNWYAVNDPRGLAPEGWHVPRQTEWAQLINFLGGDNVAGGKMKEIGVSHWLFPNTDATNSSGFTALPGGARQLGLNFYGIGILGYWWGSESVTECCSYHTYIGNDNGGCFSSSYYKNSGFSVRCIKD